MIASLGPIIIIPGHPCVTTILACMLIWTPILLSMSTFSFCFNPFHLSTYFMNEKSDIYGINSNITLFFAFFSNSQKFMTIYEFYDLILCKLEFIHKFNVIFSDLKK